MTRGVAILMFVNILLEKSNPSYPFIWVSFFGSSLSGSDVLQKDIAALAMGFIKGSRDRTDDPAREGRVCSSCTITGILHRVTLTMSGVCTTASASNPF